MPEALKQAALHLILGKYADFGPTLAHEKLTEAEGLKLSIGSVRKLMITHEIWISKRIKRKRRTISGRDFADQMVQVLAMPSPSPQSGRTRITTGL